MNMTKLILITFCLILACINIGCEKEPIENPENLISGTYFFNRGFKPFLTKEFHFDTNSFAQSFDNTPAEEMQLRHDYKIKKFGRNAHMFVKWDGEEEYQNWCKVRVYGDFIYLDFNGREVVLQAQ